MYLMDYTDEELEFLRDVLAFGIIEMTKECMTAENIGKGLCKDCPHKRVCDAVKEIFDMG